VAVTLERSSSGRVVRPRATPVSMTRLGRRCRAKHHKTRPSRVSRHHRPIHRRCPDRPVTRARRGRPRRRSTPRRIRSAPRTATGRRSAGELAPRTPPWLRIAKASDAKRAIPRDVRAYAGRPRTAESRLPCSRERRSRDGQATARSCLPRFNPPVWYFNEFDPGVSASRGFLVVPVGAERHYASRARRASRGNGSSELVESPF
jgi:hypothetical protein